MDILQYTFFQNALVGILLISIVAAIIGSYIVTRRMVFIAGGLTHASFGGLGIGYFAGISPTLSALAFAIITALGIEFSSHTKRIREDSAIALFWAVGMAVGIIFIFLTPGYTPGLSEFLFGNILTITTSDIILFAIYALVLLVYTIWQYRPILYTAFDTDFARIKGINTRRINTTMMLLIAIGVVLSIRLIGIMLLLSVLTLPQIIAELYTNRYKYIMLLSGIISLVGSVVGLFASAIIAVPTGACIVVMMVVMYAIAKGAHMLHQRHIKAVNIRQ
ncbi:MAG: metal ABC transporter permease [Bacteroidaceae bacterium]|nr:metal ABC transporter permease [Bacteroidaceae bacterium]